ncbi:hypothetical protein WN982_22040 [Paraburkholderia sp. IMGN_8]|uniref:hypothetical protein n=1 Tax=Paraburkholderia sp. IMGN_8 TaxID=3136564 RepID=UPI003100E32D
MLSTFITQWENANLAAFQLFSKLVAQSANPAGLAGATSDAGAWRAFVRTVLQSSQQYTTASQSAFDTGWREQRDRFGLAGAAAAIKELAAIQADLAARMTQGHVQHTGALTDAAAQYLDDLSRSRSATDAAMAFGRFANDVQAQSRAQALHTSSVAGSVSPALTQWVEKHLSDDNTEQAK